MPDCLLSQLPCLVSRPAGPTLDMTRDMTMIAGQEVHPHIGIREPFDGQDMHDSAGGGDLDVAGFVPLTPIQDFGRVDLLRSSEPVRLLFGPDIDPAQVTVPTHQNSRRLCQQLMDDRSRLCFTLGRKLRPFMSDDTDVHTKG